MQLLQIISVTLSNSVIKYVKKKTMVHLLVIQFWGTWQKDIRHILPIIEAEEQKLIFNIPGAQNDTTISCLRMNQKRHKKDIKSPWRKTKLRRKCNKSSFVTQNPKMKKVHTAVQDTNWLGFKLDWIGWIASGRPFCHGVTYNRPNKDTHLHFPWTGRPPLSLVW